MTQLLWDGLRDYVRFGLYTLARMSPGEILLLFWPCFLLDLPRYTLTKIPILAAALWRRRPGGRHVDPAFLARWEAQGVPVTVVLSGHNEESTVGMTVRSLLAGSYRNVEIVAVDDGSTDRTYAVLRAAAGRDPRLRPFRLRRRCGKSAAVNLALAVSRGEVVVVVDADTTFDRHAVREILRPFADPRVGAVSGNLRVRNRRASLCTRLQAAEYLKCIATGRRWMCLARYLAIASGAFGAFRRAAVAAAGFWDVGPGEDADTTLKVRKQGFQVRFAPRAVCYTNVPVSFEGLARQRTRWNRNYIRRLRKHRDVFVLGRYDSGTHLNTYQGVLFRIVVLVSTLLYLYYLVFHVGALLPHVVVFVLLFYATTNLFTLGVALVLSPDVREDLRLLPLVPLLPMYRAFLKLVRARAYLLEALRLAPPDRYVPARVQREAPSW